MNEEKKIAQAIIDAQKMREESYVPDTSILTPSYCGEYTKEIEECLISTCKQRGLSTNLWVLLNLAMHWHNDIQLWAEDVLAERDVGADDCPCDVASKQACEQCQETGIANMQHH